MDNGYRLSLPTLVGVPAYGRPQRSCDPPTRPFSVDDLPIEALRTEDERLLAAAAERPAMIIDLEAARAARAPRGGLRALASRVLSGA